ncbi:hypothetical protein CC80DRAFT_547249 [Byssothecium circinans]|uniref:Uncharacterized protein n=1 Tax=Byssothecium circinans TaxID=147558 RepID=A0A6A5TY34_9PLEO|nr:hypothetical protein CC80DRAFT_547249 [Byssothecium circinans]
MPFGRLAFRGASASFFTPIPHHARTNKVIFARSDTDIHMQLESLVWRFGASSIRASHCPTTTDRRTEAMGFSKPKLRGKIDKACSSLLFCPSSTLTNEMQVKEALTMGSRSPESPHANPNDEEGEERGLLEGQDAGDQELQPLVDEDGEQYGADLPAVAGSSNDVGFDLSTEDGTARRSNSSTEPPQDPLLTVYEFLDEDYFTDNPAVPPDHASSNAGPLSLDDGTTPNDDGTTPNDDGTTPNDDEGFGLSTEDGTAGRLSVLTEPLQQPLLPDPSFLSEHPSTVDPSDLHNHTSSNVGLLPVDNGDTTNNDDVFFRSGVSDAWSPRDNAVETATMDPLDLHRHATDDMTVNPFNLHRHATAENTTVNQFNLHRHAGRNDSYLPGNNSTANNPFSHPDYDDDYPGILPRLRSGDISLTDTTFGPLGPMDNLSYRVDSPPGNDATNGNTVGQLGRPNTARKTVGRGQCVGNGRRGRGSRARAKTTEDTEENASENDDEAESVKLNKNGRPRKLRAPRQSLRTWGDRDVARAYLGVIWACGEVGIEIPFGMVAQFVHPKCTVSGIQQSILKLREHYNKQGEQVPRLRMRWPTRNAAPVTPAEAERKARNFAKLPRRKESTMMSMQSLVVTLKCAYRPPGSVQQVIDGQTAVEDPGNGSPTVENPGDGSPTVENSGDGSPAVENPDNSSPTVENSDNLPPAVENLGNGSRSASETVHAPVARSADHDAIRALANWRPVTPQDLQFTSGSDSGWPQYRSSDYESGSGFRVNVRAPQPQGTDEASLKAARRRTTIAAVAPGRRFNGSSSNAQMMAGNATATGNTTSTYGRFSTAGQTNAFGNSFGGLSALVQSHPSGLRRSSNYQSSGPSYDPASGFDNNYQNAGMPRPSSLAYSNGSQGAGMPRPHASAYGNPYQSVGMPRPSSSIYSNSYKSAGMGPSSPEYINGYQGAGVSRPHTSAYGNLYQSVGMPRPSSTYSNGYDSAGVSLPSASAYGNPYQRVGRAHPPSSAYSNGYQSAGMSNDSDFNFGNGDQSSSVNYSQQPDEIINSSRRRLFAGVNGAIASNSGGVSTQSGRQSVVPETNTYRRGRSMQAPSHHNTNFGSESENPFADPFQGPPQDQDYQATDDQDFD